MRKGPKIKIALQPTADNEIQFADALNGAALALQDMAKKVLEDGDAEQFYGTHHVVHADNDDAEDVGDITIDREGGK